MLKEPSSPEPLLAPQEEVALQTAWCTGFLPGLEPVGLPAPTWMGVKWPTTSPSLPAERSPGWLRRTDMAFHPYEWDVSLVLLDGVEESALRERLARLPTSLSSSLLPGAVAWWWLDSRQFAVAGFDRGSGDPFQRWVNGLGPSLRCQQQPVFSQDLVCLDRLMVEGDQTLAVLGRMLQAGWSSRHVELLSEVTAASVVGPEKGPDEPERAEGDVLSRKQ